MSATLESILLEANRGAHPYAVHQRYEGLHPFMDGNGRSGRAIWLWQMVNQDHGDRHALQRGFLHSFYYQEPSIKEHVMVETGDMEGVEKMEIENG